MGWFVHLKSRWPELKVLAPRGLELQRAKATSKDSVGRYYCELGRVLTKYNLTDRPERIYNVDEKGLSTTHKPPAVVSAAGCKPPAVVSASRINITVIGCGNAQGHQIPPFFVFPGSRMNNNLLLGGSPGVDGTVTESGWSNRDVFQRYLQNHLLRFVPERTPSSPVLILYDGHRSHINLGLVQWAKEQNIILLVLPAHTSHVLQPMDVGCFGPFERIFNNICHKFMRQNCGRSITKFDICQLGSAAYLKALSPENLQASFRKAGIYPLNPTAVDPSNFLPSTTLQQLPAEDSTVPTSLSQSGPSTFFKLKEKPLTEKKPATKKRKYLSYVVSGKAITENEMVEAIETHQQQQKSKKPKATCNTPMPAIPSTSGTCNKPADALQTDDTSDDEIDESEKCCVCQQFTPDAVRKSTSLIFVKWVKCDLCDHWVHLGYCTNVKVVRRHDSFSCMHCSSAEE